jgi:osmotically-inducible protein OsmY
MKMKTTLFSVFALAMMIGCGNTADGMKQDSEVVGEKTAQGAENMTKDANEAGGDIGAATMLTPKLKNAIIANARLNEEKNLIDISSTEEMVTIDGHVTSEELKALAEEVVTTYLKDSNATQKVKNNLTIMK